MLRRIGRNGTQNLQFFLRRILTSLRKTVINTDVTVSAITTPRHHIIDWQSRPLLKNISIGSFGVIISVSIKIEHIEAW